VPRFSVVIPLYNKASYIARSIDSVLKQEVDDFELLVVNDGSTDGSEKIVVEYSDPRVRLINQPNAGESAARNTGISGSTSPYIAFLDADDSWDADFLKVINKLTEEFPEAGAYAAHVRDPQSHRLQQFHVYDSTRVEESWMIENYFDCLNSGYYPVTSSSVCVKRSILININGFDESLKIGPDIDAWIRVFLNSGIALSNRYAATYHTDAENRSVHRSDYVSRELEFFVHLRDRYLTESLDGRSRVALDEWTSSRIHQIIIRCIYQGDKRFAARVLRGHWGDLRGRQRLVGLTRLCTPNALVELLKGLGGREA